LPVYEDVPYTNPLGVRTDASPTTAARRWLVARFALALMDAVVPTGPIAGKREWQE